MKQKKILLLTLGSLFITPTWANGFYGEANVGAAKPYFSNTNQTITLTPGLDNTYNTTSPGDTDALFGLSVGYHWDFTSSNLSLASSVYRLFSRVKGVNTPFVNAGSGFPTLDYSANGYSTALMLEPKWTFTKYAWQPYVLAGAGVASNHFTDYQETQTDPTSSARPTNTPFAGKTLTSFAYEGGVGIQHALTSSPGAPIAALDYRYMNWGHASFGNANAASSSLNLGQFTTRTVTLGILWPF